MAPRISSPSCLALSDRYLTSSEASPAVADTWDIFFSNVIPALLAYVPNNNKGLDSIAIFPPISDIPEPTFSNVDDASENLLLAFKIIFKS